MPRQACPNRVAVLPGSICFVGVSWQRSNASATLRGKGNDAQFVVQQVQRYFRQPKHHMMLLPGCCA